MPYIGKSPLHGNYQKLDSISGSFDGSITQFALTQNSSAITPVTEAALIISINGVLQEPVTTYTVSGTNITFTSAPASTDTFFGVALGEQLAIGTPSDSSVTSAKLSGNLVTPGTLDLNGQELILDANANTSITADTDDQIDFKISGADDFRMTANNFNVLSGSTLTIDSGATITNSGTATGFGSNVPTSADGQALGSASAEWSDLYLADGGVVYFGNDQEITLTHNADKVLLLKHTATDDDKPVSLVLQTGETDMAANDIIGSIEWQAPDEGTGTDAILVSAAIKAYAEGDHSSSSNATTLGFYTGASEAAAIKMSLSSAGALDVTGDITGSTLNADGDTAAGDNAAIGYTASEGLILTGQGSTDDITIKNDTDDTVLNVPTGGTDVEVSAGNLLFGTAGKGIYLGVTAATSANHLDDYEEGGWTPVLTGTSGVSGTQVYNAQAAKYIKVGNIVHCNCNIGITNKQTISGGLIVTGLPFTGTNSAGVWDAGISFGYVDGFDLSAGHMLIGRVRADQPDIVLQEIEWQDDAATSIGTSHLVVTAYLYISFTYNLT